MTAPARAHPPVRTTLWPVEPSDRPFGEVFDRHEAGVPVDPNLERWQGDPIAWMVEVMGVPEHTLRWSLNPGYETHRWDGHRDPLVAICEGLAAWEDVGVEAATGTQKTYTAALLLLWFLDVWRPSADGQRGGIVVTEAPKEDQLRLHLWKEVGELWPRFHARHPDAELTDLRIRMRPGRDDWGAVGFAVGVGRDEESATKAQGFHAEHMLLITEETPGIKPAVMTANQNTCTAPHNLRLGLGNPDHQQDELHKFCLKATTRHVRISGLDHPNVVTGNASVVPGAVSLKSVAVARADYGEDGRLYLSRVRGLSPTEAVDALIKHAWILAAMRKTPEERRALRADGPPAAGVDVAGSEGGDRAAIARGEGRELLTVTTHKCPDPNAFYTEHVEKLLPARANSAVGVDAIPPERIGVDVGGGYGAGTVNEARRVNVALYPYNGSNDPLLSLGRSEKFKNQRAQDHWLLADDLHHGRLALPPDLSPTAIADLTSVKWGTQGGKIFMEPKEDVKARLGRSPDEGDAIVIWNRMRQQPGFKKPDPKGFRAVGIGT